MGGMPDWLAELAPDVDFDDEPDAPGVAASGVESPALVADDDLMGGLRGQLGAEAADSAPAASNSSPRAKAKRAKTKRVKSQRAGARGSASLGMDFLPWQQFALSVMLFFDVAIVGLLVLVMLERIVIR